MKCFDRFLTDTKYAISWGILGFITLCGVSSVYLVVNIFDDNDLFRGDTIEVSGTGEVNVVPDVATFTYTVSEVSESVESAQELSAAKNNIILEVLKENGVEDKDIKTLSYNIYPKYEWQQIVCITTPCRGGENVLVGQEASQRIQVIVRDTEKAGELLAIVGANEVSNISGLSFEVEDRDNLKGEARELAILNAKAKAKKLADQLNIDLDNIVYFYEDDQGVHYPMYEYAETKAYSVMEDSIPEIQTGEDTISVTVRIGFEIED